MTKQESARQWYLKNREKQLAYAKSYRESHPDIVKMAKTKWRLDHPEEVKAEQSRYREKHREARRQWDLDPANRETATALQRERRRANPAKHREEIHARRARIAGNGGSYTASEWNDLAAVYNNRCLRCGKQEPEIKLTVDHVIPITIGGANTVDNLQPLCASCNSSKGSKHIDYRPQVLAAAA